MSLAPRSILAAAILLAIASPSAAADRAASLHEGLAAGTAASPFVLPDLHGRDFNAAEYLGHSVVVLSFWSIYCDTCVEEMLSLQKLEDKYQGKGLVILAVNEDIRLSKDRIRRFLERLEKYRGKISYPILFDQESRVFSAYRGTDLPTLVLIDKEGKVVSFYRGFDPARERELLGEIEKTVFGTPAVAPAPAEIEEERRQVFSVMGEAALCGFFDDSGWRKSFTGSEAVQQELELTRDLARRDATRQAVVEALRILGIRLFSNNTRRDCVDGAGIHLDRDPFNTRDPVSNLLNILSYDTFFETVSEQEMLLDNRYFASRRVRAGLDSLDGELESMGYLFKPMRIQFTYVNMSPLDQKEFLLSLLNQSKFVGKFENPVFSSHSTSQTFEVYTSSQGFADEILKMDFGKLKVFVEQVTPTTLELEIWK